MKNVCQKCGAETEYSGDLHCRKIFIQDLKDLLRSSKIKEAELLFLSSDFDDSWKTMILQKSKGEFKSIMEVHEKELKRKETELKHKEYLSAIGIEYRGTSKTSKSPRTTHCYNCKAQLDNSFHVECNACGWIICGCGACGCGYNLNQ